MDIDKNNLKEKKEKNCFQYNNGCLTLLEAKEMELLLEKSKQLAQIPSNQSMILSVAKIKTDLYRLPQLAVIDIKFSLGNSYLVQQQFANSYECTQVADDNNYKSSITSKKNFAKQLVNVFLEFLKSFEDFESTELCKQLLNIEIAVFLDAFIDRIETIDKNESNKLIAYQITNLISKADGYTYIYYKCNELNDGVSFTFYCNCRFERQQKRARIEDITKQRNTEPQLPRYESYIRIHHLTYPRPQSTAITSEIKEFIQQNKLLTVLQIYHNIKALYLNGYLHVMQCQVYYWCKWLGLNEYKMAEDQAELTIQYLFQHKAFKLIIQEDTAIAFTTPLLDLLKEQITMIVIDTTYKNNRLNYELYAILGIIDGSGFPLTYLFLKPGQQEKYLTILLNWFHIIKLQGINNIHTFLTDKGFSQITSAQTIWPHVQIQLCYWHVLRAIKKKLSSSGIYEWYQPGQWELWARSATKYINILRSTMTIENHWKIIKHNYLSEYNLEDDTVNELLYKDDNTIEDKKKEFYLLLDSVKVIIDENIQTPNAEKWLNSVDKNFNTLWKMLNKDNDEGIRELDEHTREEVERKKNDRIETVSNIMIDKKDATGEIEATKIRYSEVVGQHQRKKTKRAIKCTVDNRYKKQVTIKVNRDQIFISLRKKIAMNFLKGLEIIDIDVYEIAQWVFYLAGFAKITMKILFETTRKNMRVALAERLVELSNTLELILEMIKNILLFDLSIENRNEIEQIVRTMRQ
ncbi:44792_t:CDS:2, partial [Gigaspora margarita]